MEGINNCKLEGKDIGCEYGCCPDCNYYDYLCWLKDHLYCNVGADCPDENDCPHRMEVPWVMNSD